MAPRTRPRTFRLPVGQYTGAWCCQAWPEDGCRNPSCPHHHRVQYDTSGCRPCHAYRRDCMEPSGAWSSCARASFPPVLWLWASGLHLTEGRSASSVGVILMPRNGQACPAHRAALGLRHGALGVQRRGRLVQLPSFPWAGRQPTRNVGPIRGTRIWFTRNCVLPRGIWLLN